MHGWVICQKIKTGFFFSWVNTMGAGSCGGFTMRFDCKFSWKSLVGNDRKNWWPNFCTSLYVSWECTSSLGSYFLSLACWINSVAPSLGLWGCFLQLTRGFWSYAEVIDIEKKIEGDCGCETKYLEYVLYSSNHLNHTLKRNSSVSWYR